MDDFDYRDFAALARRAHATAVEKGWHDRPRTVVDTINLICSEAMEAFEELRKGHAPDYIYYRDSDGKPEGFTVEIADALIRIADTLESAGEPATVVRSYYLGPIETASELVFWLNIFSAEASCRLEKNMRLSPSALKIGAWLIYDSCERMSLPLERAIREKMAYNETRPYRHGGKAI